MARAKAKKAALAANSNDAAPDSSSTGSTSVDISTEENEATIKAEPVVAEVDDKKAKVAAAVARAKAKKAALAAKSDENPAAESINSETLDTQAPVTEIGGTEAAITPADDKKAKIAAAVASAKAKALAKKQPSPEADVVTRQETSDNSDDNKQARIAAAVAKAKAKAAQKRAEQEQQED